MSNRQCGYGVRNSTVSVIKDNPSQKIYEDGCLSKGEEWLKFHILPVSIVVVCLAVLQVSLFIFKFINSIFYYLRLKLF